MNFTLSMSAVATYLRCPNKFKLRYLEGWEDIRAERPALADGTAFHNYMEHYAKGIKDPSYRMDLDWATPMGEVAIGYLTYSDFPQDIISADDAQFVQIFPNCRLRTTFDLVYTNGNMLVIRDYKTFDRAPSLDIDLDFQARVYLWAAKQIWPGYEVYMFEHIYVRRTLPHIVKDKSGGKWEAADCYKRQQMILSAEEVEADGLELKQTINDILTYEASPKRIWTRVPLKGGGYDQCTSCSVKELCKADKLRYLHEISDYEALAERKDTVYDIVGA